MYNTRNIGLYECTENGDVIKEWPSITAAAKQFKMCRHKLASIIDTGDVYKDRLWKMIPDPDLENEIWVQFSKTAYISNLGRYKTESGKKHYGTMKNSYLSVCSTNQHYFVHRLVATYFNPCTRSDLVVDHVDGDTTNNKASNLQWVTSSENLKRAHKRKRS